MASSSKKVIIAALIGNSLIAVTKFIAAAMTGSSAMLSEGIHSLVDTGNQVLLLYGLKRAQRPPDERFPFGHGKEIYFWSFVVAILIFAVGAGVSLYEGIKHMMHPTTLTNPIVNYVVLSLAIVFEGFALGFALKEFRKQKGRMGYFEAVQRGKDPSIFVVLFEDSAAMLGLLVALAGVALTDVTGLGLFDGLASVVVGLILAGTAIWLAIETKGLLIGEGADQQTIRGIRALADSKPGVTHVNEILTLHMGPNYILVTISIDFDDQLATTEMERVITQVDTEIKESYPEVKRVFVEAEARRIEAVRAEDRRAQAKHTNTQSPSADENPSGTA